MTDQGNSVARVYTCSGQLVTSFGKGKILWPRGIALDKNKNLLIADCGKQRISVFDGKTYKYLKSFGESVIKNPVFIAVDLPYKGDIYVTDWEEKCIKVFNHQHDYIRTFGKGNNPCGLAIDTKGRLVVSYYADHTISIMTLDGKVLSTFGSKGNAPGQFSLPIGVAISPDGKVLVTEKLNNRLQLLEYS